MLILTLVSRVQFSRRFLSPRVLATATFSHRRDQPYLCIVPIIKPILTHAFCADVLSLT
jgi:hypothetical protein